MTRVFIAEPVSFDLSGAAEYGEITTLFDRFNPLATDAVRIVLDRLKDLSFDPTQDWIVVSGKSATLVILIAAVAAVYERLPILIFDARNSSYVQRIFDWDSYTAS